MKQELPKVEPFTFEEKRKIWNRFTKSTRNDIVKYKRKHEGSGGYDPTVSVKGLRA